MPPNAQKETPKGLPTESAHPGERPSPSPPPPLPFLPAPLRAPRPPWCMVSKRVDGPCVMCQGIVNPFNLLSNVPEPCLPSCHLLTPSGRARSSFLAGRQVLQTAPDLQEALWLATDAEAKGRAMSRLTPLTDRDDCVHNMAQGSRVLCREGRAAGMRGGRVLAWRGKSTSCHISRAELRLIGDGVVCGHGNSDVGIG